MTKNDLKPGMIIETRDGEFYMVYEFEGGIIVANEDGWLSLDDYDNNLNFKLKDDQQGYDILKVRKPDFAYLFSEKYWDETPVVWERKNIKLTEEEKSLLKMLDPRYKWLVRNCDSCLVLYTNKPQRFRDGWSFVCGDYAFLNSLDEKYIKFDFISKHDTKPTSLDELRKY